MKEVTREEFYNSVGNKDSVLSIVGSYPYTTEFRIRYKSALIGKIVDQYTDPLMKSYPIISKYFLIE